MKYIKRKSAVKPITGNIVDTFNVEDKTTNAPSIRAVEDKLTYSTEEKQIGYWIDGKPLYRKVLNVGALLDTANKSIPINVSDLDKIINMYGYSYNGSVFIPLPYPHTTSLSSQITISFNVDTNYLIVGTGSDRTAFTETYVTIEYTKTTD